MAPNAAAPAISFTWHCDATESTNAIYHLACLAGQLPCTKAAFERFWHDTLQWTPADQRELDAWSAGMKKVESAAGPPTAAPYLGNYRSFFPDIDAWLQIIHTALESRSPSEFRRRTQRWLNDEEAARLQHAISHFVERLRPWWRTTGHDAVTARMRQTQRQLRGDTIAALAREMAAFVEAESPATDFSVHLIPAPNPKSDEANGTFVSNHIFMEVNDAATPDGIASVSLHELTHYLYETAQPRRHRELMQQFVRAEVPDASALYALLNEALASAAQGLMYERAHGAPEPKGGDDEYRHLFIPRLGYSTVPVLKEALAKGSTLYRGFPEAYAGAAIRELGSDVSNPRFFLTSAAILPTDKAAGAREVFLEEFQPLTTITSDQWRLFPDLNLVFLMAYDELGGLATTFPDLGSYTSSRGFAYMGSRDGQARICILAGVDRAAIADVVRAFAKLRSAASPGLLLSID